MRFVDDDGVVLPQLGVSLQLGEQHAVGHELDYRVAARLVGEADLAADLAAKADIQLLGYAAATELAATRRGWVQAMRPRSPRPAARHIFGICVVLPEPVSPASTSTWLFWMAVTISSARPLMGSSGGYSIRKGQDFLGRDDMSMPAILGENRNPQPEMTNSVETTPEEKMYRRVLFVSGFDGWSVVIVAGLGTLLSLLFTSLNGIFVGLLLIGAGAMELHGRRLLRRRNAEGMRWLVRAQVFLLGVILVYCVSRLGSFDAETAMGNLTPEMQAALNEAGVTTADLMPLVHVAFFATYAIVAVVSLFFQGGLAMYYRSRTARVTAFLTGSPHPCRRTLAGARQRPRLPAGSDHLV